MTPNFFAAPEETTAAAAVEPIREMVDVEMVFYVYVVDEENRLKGVISLRQLVATKSDTPLKDLMTTRVYTVYTHTPQEEVAQVVARYNLLAVPVLDDTDGLVGIVTIDDVVDVIREENTEDVLKMAGTGDVDIASKSVFRNTRARLPWLLASFAGGLIAVYMIGQFQEPLEKITALAFFYPNHHGDGRKHRHTILDYHCVRACHRRGRPQRSVESAVAGVCDRYDFRCRLRCSDRHIRSNCDPLCQLECTR